MKKPKLKMLYPILLAVSIVGGVGYGTIVSKEAWLKEMPREQMETLLASKETAIANIEQIFICTENGYHWIVVLKKGSPKEYVFRDFTRYEGEFTNPEEQASQYGIKMTVATEEAGSQTLLKQMLGLH